MNQFKQIWTELGEFLKSVNNPCHTLTLHLIRQGIKECLQVTDTPESKTLIDLKPYEVLAVQQLVVKFGCSLTLAQDYCNDDEVRYYRVDKL